MLALRNASDEDIENIARIVDDYLERMKTEPSTVQDELDFHRAVFGATHNQYVIKIGETMLDLLVSSMQRKPVRAEEFTVKTSHVGICEALKDRDEEKLMQVLEESFAGWEIKYFTEHTEHAEE
jgi:DNA-binding FadR family transcriptional regulator